MAQFDDRFEGEHLEELRRKEEDSLIRALSVQYGYQFVDLRGVTINPEALQIIDEARARRAMAVGFELRNKKLSVAIRNPNNPAAKELLQELQQQGWQLNLVMTSTSSLEHAWKRYADQKDTAAVKRGVLDIDPTRIGTLMRQLTELERIRASIQDIRTLNSARRVSETLEAIFAGALALGASDIHIEPEEAGIRLRYRLDGVLHDVLDLERKIYDRLISRLKLLAGMILNVRDEAQDGRFTFDVGEKLVEVRASIIPGASGESMVMRLLDPTVASFSLDTLGLNPILDQVMRAELRRPNGMIITTGPTGSGKTTALYAFLRHVHAPGIKIITIENPVEYKLDDIVQTQVSEEYGFDTALRAVLRQDPDVIMVGEIRDREVAETAVHAAQTGHLVFSTLHTNSAVGAFPRLIDLGVDYRVIGSSVNVVLGQRLVRLLCPQCKQAREATPAEQALIKRIATDHPGRPTLPSPLMLFDPVGCDACSHSGFRGRAGVFEAILVDEAVEEAVIRDPREHVIIEAARPQGIPDMAQDGIDRVLRGETSLAELERVVDLARARSAIDTPAPAEPGLASPAS